MLPTRWILTFALGLSACAQPTGPSAPDEPPALTIDGEPIARRVFVDALMADQGEAFAKRFVARHQVEKAAAAAKVTVDAAKVQAALDAEVRSVVAGRFGGDRAKFEAHVTSYGVTMESWRAARLDHHRLVMTARAIMQADVPAEKVRALFEQRYGAGGVRRTVRQILVSTHVASSRLYTRKDFEAERAEVERGARDKAAAIRQRLLNGGDFAAEARAQSDDFSAERGGDLAAAWSGRYGKVFDDAVARLDVGQISPVLEGRRGYSIVQVTGVRKGVRYRGSQIVVRHAEHGGEVAATARCREARAKIADGTPFSRVAAIYTDDQEGKPTGGALGVFGPGRLAPQADAVLEALPIGAVSEPILAADACLLVRLDERTFLPGQDTSLVRHILISTEYDKVKARRIGPDLEAKAKAKAEAVLARLQAGDDFAKLARANSEDPLTARVGGKLSVYRKGTLGPKVHAALVGMKPGERALVRSKRGFHIVELVSERRADFAGVEAELRAELKKRRPSDEEVAAWIRAQGEKAKVELSLRR